ncbi:hypothetical protein [Enterococcus phage vB_Efm3_KEN20]
MLKNTLISLKKCVLHEHSKHFKLIKQCNYPIKYKRKPLD